jgi:hypothetical protein
MSSITLTNPNLKKLTDINQNTYYLLVNPTNPDDAYFCFPKTVVAGWNQLECAFEQGSNLTQVSLEYQEQERGMRIYKQVLRVEIGA